MKTMMLMRSLLLVLFCWCSVADADRLEIHLEIPVMDVDPYHRPYVAIWLETSRRKGIETLALWVEKDDWLKDLRQWWRKLGNRGKAGYDAVTSATRKPGRYRVSWQTGDIPQGEYYLCMEASREAGGRDFLRQKILIGYSGKQSFSLPENLELGRVEIQITP